MKPEQTYIALIRGINVGGKNILPMQELAVLLQELGCHEVTTYIQSGNAVFRSPLVQADNLAERIAEVINKRYGFKPNVLLLTSAEIKALVSANPYPDACSDGKTLHLYFLSETATKPDLNKLAQLQSNSERFEHRARVLYLHAPNGIGRSKLAANVEKALGVPVTARNWNTVCKLLQLAEQPH